MDDGAFLLKLTRELEVIVGVVEVDIDKLVVDPARTRCDRLIVLEPKAARVVAPITITLAHSKEGEINQSVLPLSIYNPVSYENIVIQVCYTIIIEILESGLTLLSHLVVLMANRACS